MENKEFSILDLTKIFGIDSSGVTEVIYSKKLKVNTTKCKYGSKLKYSIPIPYLNEYLKDVINNYKGISSNKVIYCLRSYMAINEITNIEKSDIPEKLHFLANKIVEVYGKLPLSLYVDKSKTISDFKEKFSSVILEKFKLIFNNEITSDSEFLITEICNMLQVGKYFCNNSILAYKDMKIKMCGKSKLINRNDLIDVLFLAINHFLNEGVSFSNKIKENIVRTYMVLTNTKTESDLIILFGNKIKKIFEDISKKYDLEKLPLFISIDENGNDDDIIDEDLIEEEVIEEEPKEDLPKEDETTNKDDSDVVVEYMKLIKKNQKKLKRELTDEEKDKLFKSIKYNIPEGSGSEDNTNDEEVELPQFKVLDKKSNFSKNNESESTPMSSDIINYDQKTKSFKSNSPMVSNSNNVPVKTISDDVSNEVKVETKNKSDKPFIEVTTDKNVTTIRIYYN